ncbi:hypothetical protein YTPLAS18_10390 [Nitrospira sp.]|nr:hypothetical protein YTPLAS18_10390 [Nitrospira sp.]
MSLATLAKEVNLSPYHIQRMFTRSVGLSPSAYQRAARAERFKLLLKRGYTITRALYDCGFGSSSRLYDRTDGELGMLPRTYRSGGKGMTLRYATGRIAVGHLLIAVTSRGIAAANLGSTVSQLRASLRRDFPHAVLRQDQSGLSHYLRAFRQSLAGEQSLTTLPLDVQGTAFQWKIWKALQRIPRGRTQSYQEIARSIGHPKAARAVARACATNRVALAIPCHRAVRMGGHLAGYRWGIGRKRKLVALERT